MRHAATQHIKPDGAAAPVRNFQWLTRAAMALALLLSGAAQAQGYVNMTIGGAFAPGVYGQIAIGNNTPPPVINVRPVLAGRPVRGAAPLYLHVAPSDIRHWNRNCSRYGACGRPVHFVNVNHGNRWWEHHGVPVDSRASERFERNHTEPTRIRH